MSKTETAHRHLGLAGATGVGVGAIVGGGILALAGVAFATTGPSAIAAFALNGIIAVLTALSFAEMSTKFPQSGGTYAFARKVLSVESAFGVGWVVGFASIVAAVLYAIGFGAFGSALLSAIWQTAGQPAPEWLSGRLPATGLALGATGLFTLGLVLRSGGGGQWVNVGKVVVFAVLILGGLWAVPGRSAGELAAGLTPFFSAGFAGLIQAMGFTFIALQGFDLIAAVAGEIRDPSRTIPRSMLLSLGIALAIYLPLLLLISTVGMQPGQSVAAVSAGNPETIVAVAAENYLGPFGYWLVLVAGVLSMLSALQANLLAASRVIMAMSRDRSLPPALSRLSREGSRPVAAVLATGAIVAAILVVVPSVAAAGAAASLIFLITFALAHWITVLVRRRSVDPRAPGRAPFPLVPVTGGLACAALAVYQGIAVPTAGLITATWLSLGAMLFLGLFARRARVVDASSAAMDPEVVRLRGSSPLVLVPIANPDNAESLVAVANALAPPEVGRVLLLTVMVADREWRPRDDPGPLHRTQSVLVEALAASVNSGLYPETLTTVADRPWPEIARVARVHGCESLLLGFGALPQDTEGTGLDELINSVDCDIVVVRAPKSWQLRTARRILVPVGGRGGHDRLLARMLGSLVRTGTRDVSLLRVLKPHAGAGEVISARRELEAMVGDHSLRDAQVVVSRSDSAVEEVASYANQSDLVILGVQWVHRRKRLLGEFVLQIARRTECPMIVISHRG